MRSPISLSVLILCIVGVVVSTTLQHPMAMTPTASSTEPCIMHPQNSSCTDFNLPNTHDYISNLCGQMSNMPGCSIESICHDHQDLQSSTQCSEMSIFRTLCTDMPMMSGCRDFVSMCSNVSVVAACQTEIFAVPSTMYMQQQITAICNSHYMEGCDKCPDNFDCDLLMVYSEMCYMMPKMTECAGWATMCADETAKTWPMCDLSHSSSAAHISAVTALIMAATIIAF